MKKQFNDYYIGLDAGTNTLGWAVTDTDYNILKFNGKSMWGTRLFDEGNSAAERRGFRSATRRAARKKARIELLEEIFAEEISTVDPGFYQRIKESKFGEEDKTIGGRYCLFNDKDFTDKDYHKTYPTIYHLRKALIEKDEKFDVRLLFLALHHIVKNRGHFLFDNAGSGEIPEFGELFDDFCDACENEFGIILPTSGRNEIAETLKAQSIGITAKEKEFIELLKPKDAKTKLICKLLAGGKVALSTLFDDESLNESEKKDIKFSDASYSDNEETYRSVLQDKMFFIEKAKALYDWGLLSEILGGEKYISFAKVKVYEKHKNDLAITKRVIRKYCPDKYKEIFSDLNKEKNYAAYAGKSNKGMCLQEDVCKLIKSALGGIKEEDDKELEYVLTSCENISLLPKQTTKGNSIIPQQLNMAELEAILKNAEKHYPFLTEKDENGYTSEEKIKKIFAFRIPYYVGPLNDYHKDKGGNCWIVKKGSGKIRPWNFDEIVDTEKSAEAFILRMTNKCSYLIGKDVLPKHSPLYCKFNVLNEINNIKINGESISPALKQRIFNEKFLKFKKVTRKKLEEFLKSENALHEGDSLSGIDKEIKSSMAPMIDLQKCLGEKATDNDLCENIVKWLTLFGDDRKLLASRLKKEYGSILSSEETQALCGLKFTGWGRLSKELLTEIYAVKDKTTAEAGNIIGMMWETNENFMQLMSSKYDFANRIASLNNEACGEESDEISYDMLEDLYVSPAVRRSIWQALLICEEIRKITKRQPKKIFIEMARSDEPKGDAGRKDSRKNKLIDLYKSCKDETRELVNELEATDERTFRSERLYLYYTQMGKCVYSGDPIDLQQLYNENVYDVDHIFPRSKIKDDSIDNKVLVKRELNAKKSDHYPIEPESQQKMRSFWEMLKVKGFISEKKYDRLTRKTPLTPDELAEFINRQLVETRQSTKALAEILKRCYKDSEVVYVKAGNVADFRQQQSEVTVDGEKISHNEFVKVRCLNDIHHAKDAYLNIVVGNVYDTKFTKSPANFIKNRDFKYNLAKMYDFDVQRGDTTAWIKGENGTIATVRKYMKKNNILFTRYSSTVTGALADLQAVKKAEGLMPLKGSDPRLKNTARYGGYNKVSGAYFILVEHLLKKKRVRTVEFVPIYLAKDIEKDKKLLMEYCENTLSLVEPVILIDKMKINSLFIIDGFPAHISGRTGHSLLFKGAMQFVLSPEEAAYIKRIDKFIAYCKETKREAEPRKQDNITWEDNMAIYETFIEKLKNTKYNVMLSTQIKNLEKGKQKFAEANLKTQCEVLLEILHLFACDATGCNIKSIDGPAKAGILTLNQDITDKNITFVYQSVTGLFENRKELKNL